MLARLDPVVPMRDGRPQVGGPSHPMRAITRETAFDPNSWTPDRALEVAGFFDGLADGWSARYTDDEVGEPVTDALRRGAVPTGLCLEIGAGTGLATRHLADHCTAVIALDVSHEMLVRFREPRAALLLGDGGFLPVAAKSVDVVVLINAFLFPAEVDRVLSSSGVVVWINSLGSDTPIHLPAADVLACLPGEWDGVESEAGWSTWSVFRRRVVGAAEIPVAVGVN